MNSILYFELGKQVFHEHQVNESFIVSALHKCSDYDQALDVLRTLMGTIENKNTKDIAKMSGLPTSVVKTTVVELQTVGLIQTRVHKVEGKTE